MEGSRFDSLTRQLAARRSRRAFLKVCTVATVSLAGLRQVRAGAEPGTDSGPYTHFCQAIPPGVRDQCVSDALHGVGICYECGPLAPASSAMALCGSTCADTSGDPENCGSCGYDCAAYQTCVRGSCTGCDPDAPRASPLIQHPVTCSCVCPDDLTARGGGCVDVTGDPANCGSCGIACGPNASCTGGTCQYCAGHDYCEAQGRCVSTHRGPRQVYTPRHQGPTARGL